MSPKSGEFKPGVTKLAYSVDQEGVGWNNFYPGNLVKGDQKTIQ